jgi:hypothetical protein
MYDRLQAELAGAGARSRATDGVEHQRPRRVTDEVREGGFPDTNVCSPTRLRWHAMARREPQHVSGATALVGELVDPAGLAAGVAEVAARQRSEKRTPSSR